MKNQNKKGFTIVELVIVIAIIAILAAVLIPTFSNVIKNANESSAVQAVTSAYQDALSNVMKDGQIKSSDGTKEEEEGDSNGFYFVFKATKGALSSVTIKSGDNTVPTKYSGYTFTYDVAKSAWTATAK